MEQQMQAVPQRAWKRLLFPEPPRVLPYARAISIALRTVHIAAFSLLLGGHAFAVPAARLLPWLYLSIASGAGLIALELYSSCKWLYQGKGVMVLAKLVLIAAVARFWEQRLWLLLAALVLGSVGSHMPGRFRYYSLLHRRVI
ncbi:MAG: hypothetical protein KatS3mg131_3567 [Candidatus Tectimicrobiota bacterium]|nr:MAG: hypothetical protein KatS3mg131_3567 [Candidatus Tectomicrobia bacterium]